MYDTHVHVFSFSSNWVWNKALITLSTWLRLIKTPTAFSLVVNICSAWLYKAISTLLTWTIFLYMSFVCSDCSSGVEQTAEQGSCSIGFPNFIPNLFSNNIPLSFRYSVIPKKANFSRFRLALSNMCASLSPLA